MTAKEHACVVRGVQLMHEDGYTAMAIAVEFDVAISTVWRWLHDKGTTTRLAECEGCGVPITQPERRGRPRRFCSGVCRARTSRARVAA